MKQSIQAEAEKAAKKIREALEEFNRVTGFEMSTQGGWYSRCAEDLRLMIPTDSPYVSVVVGGFEVKA